MGVQVLKHFINIFILILTLFSCYSLHADTDDIQVVAQPFIKNAESLVRAGDYERALDTIEILLVVAKSHPQKAKIEAISLLLRAEIEIELRRMGAIKQTLITLDGHTLTAAQQQRLQRIKEKALHAQQHPLETPKLVSEADCDASNRRVFGDEPLASRLYEAAKTIPHGSWDDGEFGNESFEYLGSVIIKNNNIYVTYIQTIWGNYCGRATQRLIFFNTDFKEIGQYYGVEPPFIEGNILVFPGGEIGESNVDVSNGLPDKLNDGNDYHSIWIITN